MFRHGYASRLGVVRATSTWDTEDHKNPWFYKYLDDVKMDTVQDGKLAKVFDSGELKPIPLIFCHGLAGSRTTYSGSCRDLASHGYIVLTLSHFDGTANYSKKKNGEEKYWTSHHPHQDIEFRRDCINVRKAEVQTLMNDMFSAKFLSETFHFGEEAKMDLEKLVISGHSFGGMTALQVAHDDDRAKVLFALDPWLWVIHEQIQTHSFFL